MPLPLVTTLLLFSLISLSSSLQPKNVLNFRPVSPLLLPGLYRSATLDSATSEDAELVLSDLRIRTFIELRNDNELTKAESFSDGGRRLREVAKIVRLPLLEDVDGLFGSVVETLPLNKRVEAGFLKAFSGRSYDKVVLEELTREGGPGLLYKSILMSARPKVVEAVGIALGAREGDGVLVNCQKGKDRTGLVCILAQMKVGENRDKIEEDYAISERNLQEGGTREEKKVVEKQGGMDWGKLRGSPREAAVEVMDWIDKFGGIDKYLDIVDINT